MFCKNCGGEMNENQAICLKCGVEVGKGNSFCQNCGNAVNEGAAYCLNCGVALNAAPAADPVEEAPYLNGKDKVTAALLCFFFGGIGIHNFYMGESKKGIARIILSVLCGIGGIIALIDFIKILVGSYKYDPNAII